MVQVDWGGAIQVKKKNTEEPEARFLSWVQFCKPKKSNDIKGNRAQIETINEWYTNVQCDMTEKKCLFVHGPSGVWKSTAVILCAKEHGYHVVHTQSDAQRTPQKLDSFLRKLDPVGSEGILVLDELESFIKETTSLRWLVKLLKSPRKTLVVTICNAVDKCFQQIRDMSLVVEFYPYSQTEMYTTLLLLSQRVSGFCHLPSMDCYFVANMAMGDMCQTVNQLQILYYGSKPLEKKKKKRKKTTNGTFEKNQDSSVKMWSSSHKATSVDCFLKDEFLLDSVSGMNQDFMTNLSENLARDYILYFHNGNVSTLDALSTLSDAISSSDCNVPEIDEDRLYETENAERLSDDNINSIGCICRSLCILKGREKNNSCLKRHNKKVFQFK